MTVNKLFYFNYCFDRFFVGIILFPFSSLCLVYFLNVIYVFYVIIGFFSALFINYTVITLICRLILSDTFLLWQLSKQNKSRRYKYNHKLYIDVHSQTLHHLTNSSHSQFAFYFFNHNHLFLEDASWGQLTGGDIERG